jgi:hypothetical protein
MVYIPTSASICNLPYYCTAALLRSIIIITAATMSSPVCTIDRTILNEHTIVDMDDIGLAVFAKLCGVNRGAFVLDPPDGKTYG